MLDARPLHERVFGDPDVMRFIPRGASPSLERTRATIERFIAHEREQGFGLWAVELKETGELIGDAGLFLVEGTGPEVEVAYHFGKKSWGQGYATEAAVACIDFGFRECGLTEIIAICYPEHVASRRVMEKAGMTYAGEAQYYGTDVVKYVKRR
jgi:ribosomal-protein-alanine N-acetyltransferase